MTCLNIKRMLRIFAENPLAPRLWPAIHKGNISFGDIPKDLMARATRSYADVEKDTRRIMESAIQARIARHRLLVGEPLGRARGLIEGSPQGPERDL